MNRISNFSKFILESSSAGSKFKESISFKFAKKDLRDGYFMDDLINDIHFYGNKTPQIKKMISQIISKYAESFGVSSIRDLDSTTLKEFISKVEKVIETGGAPELIEMPSGSFLFLRDHISPDGKSCDFYINRKKTKIEVVTTESGGEEESLIFKIDQFNPESFGIEGENLEKFLLLKEID